MSSYNAAVNWNQQNNVPLGNAPYGNIPNMSCPPFPPQYQIPNVPPPPISYSQQAPIKDSFSSGPRHFSNTFQQARPQNSDSPLTMAPFTPPFPDEPVQHTLDLWMRRHNLTAHASEVLQNKQETNANKFTLSTVRLMLHKLNVLKLKLQETISTEPCTSSESSSPRQEILTEMQSLLVVLEDSRTQEMVRSKVAAAQKRKPRRRKQTLNFWEETQAKQLRIENRHKEIDQWLDGIQELKRTEQMKKAADKSMADVRQKIADVIKQKELILALTKLRSIREGNSSSSHKQLNDADAGARFAQKTSELIKLLEGRLELYRKEERALKVMLDTEQEETIAHEARIAAVRQQRQHDRLEKHKERWLFGPEGVTEELKPFYDYYNQAETEFDSFLRIRRQWDYYMVPEQVPTASQIPRGWVLPSEPSSELWQKYLKPSNDSNNSNKN